MDMNDFSKWMKKLSEDVDILSSTQRTEVLDLVIKKSDPRNLFHLSTCLEIYTKRDFLKLLPPELCEKILLNLEWPVLVPLRTVSKTWKNVIDSNTKVWKKACVDFGVILDSNIVLDTAEEYRNQLCITYHQKKLLQSGEAFNQFILEGHNGDVRAMNCYKGKVATGSDDRTVRIWDGTTGECERVYNTHSVACVKLDDDWFLTASYDCTLGMWDRESGKRLLTYSGHVAAVFVLDYLKDADLMVSGSADRTVKVWRLSTGEILTSLDPRPKLWVYEICLGHSPEMFYKGGYYIGCITSQISHPHFNQYHVWLLDSDFEIINETFWKSPKPTIMPGFTQHLDHPTEPYFMFGINDLDRSLPGVRFIRGVPLKVNREKRLVQMGWWSMGFGYHPAEDLEPKEHIISIVGNGHKFIMIGLERQDHYSSVHILEWIYNCPYGEAPYKVMCKVNVPPEYRIRGRGAAYSVGERDWLNGMNGYNTRGGVFTIACGRKVLLVSWKPSVAAPQPGSAPSISTQALRSSPDGLDTDEEAGAEPFL